MRNYLMYGGAETALFLLHMHPTLYLVEHRTFSERKVQAGIVVSNMRTGRNVYC